MARCIALLAVFLTVFQASAFLTPSTCRSQSPVVMSAENLNRREFLSKAVAGVAVGAFLGERSASAANYFGDKDAYPAVIKPQDAVIDDELLKSADVMLLPSFPNYTTCLPTSEHDKCRRQNKICFAFRSKQTSQK
mmetsp:Transcript_3822/g.5023  ORF Transcript_3822/g.5023 Transcript_3822/m.5023 type:complete len:136 (-) Transcript_3822:547-954(-)